MHTIKSKKTKEPITNNNPNDLALQPAQRMEVVQTDDQHTAEPEDLTLDKPAQEWVQKINQAHQHGVAWVVETGTMLIQAKAEIGHGQWSLIFRTGRLKFGQRVAQMLMHISEAAGLTNTHNISHLPSSYATLDVLAKLDEPSIDLGIQNREILPTMTTQDARRYVAEINGKKAVKPRAFNLEKCQERLKKLVDKQMAQWPLEHLPDLATALHKLADEAGAREGGSDSAST